MIYLNKYDELSPGMGFSSLADHFNEIPYSNKDDIVMYMKQGRIFMVCPGLVWDHIIGEKASPYTPLVHMTDGVYCWSSALTYYVEKYDLKLPVDFVEHIFKSVDSE